MNERVPVPTIMHGLAMLAIWISGIILSQAAETDSTEGRRPNIVWIMAEDISTELACYGHPAVKTPHIDALACQGARYTNAFCTAPSCTPSRNAMMLGVYQTRTDTQDQRRRGVTLPPGLAQVLSSMWLMYALMGVTHLTPWISLFRVRANGDPEF